MRTIFIGLCLVLLVPLAVMAQPDYPKAEVFGGYSYFRANPSSFDELYEWTNLHGWNASVAFNLNQWLGVEGDFSGHYGSPSFYGYEFAPFDSLLDVNYYTFMGGPKVSYRSGSVTPFAHFLIGAAHASIGGGIGSYGLTLSNETALAAAVGGGLDINLSKSFAIRAIQVDYVMTRFNPISDFPFSGLSERQNNMRLSAGVVFRF